MNKKTIIQLQRYSKDGSLLFSITTWGVSPNGNGCKIFEKENASLLDVMHLPLDLDLKTMEQMKPVWKNGVLTQYGGITIYHQ